MSSNKTLKAKKEEYVREQLRVDKALKPSEALFKKSPSKYQKAWRAYVQKTLETVEKFKKDMNYYADLNIQEEDRETFQVPKGGIFPNGKITQGTASSTLSDVSRYLQKTMSDFAPHFEHELQGLKPLFPEWAEIIENLPRANPIQYSMALNTFPANAPKRLLIALKSLPYKHQAAFYLRLEEEQYHALNTKKAKEEDPNYNPRSPGKAKKSYKNAPRVYLSAFLAFTKEVYENRFTCSWEDIMLSLMLATGRRKSELGFQALLTKAEEPGHLKTDFIAKKRLQLDEPEVFPLMFYTEKQALELFAIMRKLIRDKGIADFQASDETIESEASQFDNNAYTIRERFNERFPIEIPGPEKSVAGVLPNYVSVHTACRGIYAKVAAIYLRDHPKYSRFEPIGLANEILKHGSLKPTLAYLQFNLIDDVHTKPIDTFSPPEAQIGVETARSGSSPAQAPQASDKAQEAPISVVDAPVEASGASSKSKARKKTAPAPVPSKAEPLEGSTPQPNKTVRMLKSDKYQIALCRLAGKTKSVQILELDQYVNKTTYRTLTRQELLDVAGSTRVLNAFLKLLDEHNITLYMQD